MNAHIYAYLQSLPENDGRTKHLIGILGTPLLERVKKIRREKRRRRLSEIELMEMVNECKLLAANNEHAQSIERFARRHERRRETREERGPTELQFVSSLLHEFRPDLRPRTIETYMQRHRRMSDARSGSNLPASHGPLRVFRAYKKDRDVPVKATMADLTNPAYRRDYRRSHNVLANFTDGMPHLRG